MISGGKRHREHRHSLHLPRLASASEIPSLRSLIPELEGCVTHTSWALRFLSFLSFFFFSLSLCLAFLLSGVLPVTVSRASCCVCLILCSGRFFTLCMRTPDQCQIHEQWGRRERMKEPWLRRWNTVENDIVLFFGCTTAQRENKQTQRTYSRELKFGDHGIGKKI